MPHRPKSQIKPLARQLLAHEAGLSKPTEAENSTAFHVFEKLRGPLGRLLGLGGFRALLSRAMALAGAEIPWLLELQIQAHGEVNGLDELEGKFNARVVAEGEIVLVAQLLGLLVTFIGEELTLRLLQDIWPELDDLDF